MKAALTETVAEARDTHETRLTVARPYSGGRPVVHTEPWSKITIVMEESHVVFLDLVCICIRARHRRAVSRAELVRALVEFMEQSGIDFAQFAKADEITEHLVMYFKGIAHRGRLPLLESGLFNSTRAARTDGRRGARREN